MGGSDAKFEMMSPNNSVVITEVPNDDNIEDTHKEEDDKPKKEAESTTEVQVHFSLPCAVHSSSDHQD